MLKKLPIFPAHYYSHLPQACDAVEELLHRQHRLLQGLGEAGGRHHQERTFQQVRSNYPGSESSLKMRVVMNILSPSRPLVLQLECGNNNRKLITFPFVS